MGYQEQKSTCATAIHIEIGTIIIRHLFSLRDSVYGHNYYNLIDTDSVDSQDDFFLPLNTIENVKQYHEKRRFTLVGNSVRSRQGSRFVTGSIATLQILMVFGFMIVVVFFFNVNSHIA